MVWYTTYQCKPLAKGASKLVNRPQTSMTVEKKLILGRWCLPMVDAERSFIICMQLLESNSLRGGRGMAVLILENILNVHQSWCEFQECSFMHIHPQICRRKFAAKSKAVRFWSCPLSRCRGRIIPHRPRMPKWAQKGGKIMSRVGLEPMTSRLWGWCSTIWATTAVVNNRDDNGMSPKCSYAVYSQ